MEECLELVKNQRLFLEAISIFQNGSAEVYQQICQLYGDYLVSKKYYEDAALIFEAGKLNVEAVSAWEQSGNWYYCLSLAKSVISIPNEYSSLCRYGTFLKCLPFFRNLFVRELKKNISWSKVIYF